MYQQSTVVLPLQILIGFAIFCFFFNDTATTEIYTNLNTLSYTTLFRSNLTFHQSHFVVFLQLHERGALLVLDNTQILLLNCSIKAQLLPMHFFHAFPF